MKVARESLGNFVHRKDGPFDQTEVRYLILNRLSEGQVVDMPHHSPKWTVPHPLRAGTPEAQRAELVLDAEPRAAKSLIDAGGKITTKPKF